MKRLIKHCFGFGLSLIILLCGASPVAAQTERESAVTFPGGTDSAAAETDSDFQLPYNRHLAFGLSFYPMIGGMVIGAALVNVEAYSESNGLFYTGLGIFLAGSVIGPSLGHYYLESPLRATLTMAARGALASVPFIYLGVKSAQYDESNSETLEDSFMDGLEVAAGFYAWSIVAGAGIATLAIIDCLSAFRTAGKKNAEARKQSVSWAIAPTAIATQRGDIAPGGVLYLAF